MRFNWFLHCIEFQVGDITLYSHLGYVAYPINQVMRKNRNLYFLLLRLPALFVYAERDSGSCITTIPPLSNKKTISSIIIQRVCTRSCEFLSAYRSHEGPKVTPNPKPGTRKKQRNLIFYKPSIPLTLVLNLLIFDRGLLLNFLFLLTSSKLKLSYRIGL